MQNASGGGAGWFLWTERLGLRPWRPEDIEQAWSLWGDTRVTALLGRPYSREAVEQRLEDEMSRLREHGVQYWPMFLQQEGDFVGCCGLRPYEAEPLILEMGFHLRPEYWSKGLAREAAEAVIEYGFAALPLHSIYAGHHPENEASRRLLLRLGFVQFGEEFFERTGLMHPAYMLERSSR